jgi:hypothetical protein
MLNIWKGKVRGFSDISETKEIREGTMKGGIKQLI